MSSPLRRIARKLAASLTARPRERAPLVELDHPTEAIYAHQRIEFEVPLERCYYPYASTYGPQGWHPFVALLQQHRAARAEGRVLRYEDSVLRHYYDVFRPRTMLELLLPGEDEGEGRLHEYGTDAYTPFLPWDPGISPARGEKGLGPEHGHQAYGPVSAAKAHLEFDRLISAHDTIEREGYDPPPGDGVRGYFLVRKGAYRFVVRTGLHRAAVLAALGHLHLPVGLVGFAPRAIHLSALPTWPQVRAGVYSETQARAFFERFFAEDWYRRHLAPRLVPAAPPPEPASPETSPPERERRPVDEHREP